MDIEAKYAAQMNQLRSGNARENFELAHSKEEVKRLKDELGKLKATIAELNAELSKTRSERDSYMAQLSELQLELDRERTENARRLDELNMQIEALMASLRELMDCKMSLELEISCYKKLLEGEENRTGLRQLVEQTIGTRGSGAASLADMIQQSSMSSSTGRLTIQRQAKGPCTIRSVEQSGSNIVIENTSSGARAKSQNLDGWSIEKEVNGKVTFKVALPDFELEPKGAFTIWAKGAKAVKSDKSEMIADFFSFGTGNGVFTLRDQTGQEKAQLTMRFVEQS
ncbi:hypothetical protein C0Q70_17922 [Pomacea canaliculata]|nr:hypothetical protein C0Q70_17922 [Pomacea canaliculata]